MDVRYYAKAISNLLGSEVGFSLVGTDYSTLVINGDATKPSEAAIAAEYTTVEAAGKLDELREQRNKLLAETDWWALSDRTMTQAQTDYRQALRDITDTYSSITDDGFAWPIKPE